MFRNLKFRELSNPVETEVFKPVLILLSLQNNLNFQVKAIGDLIEIHLEHKSRGDEFGGMVSRSIMRCYHMPKGADPKTLRSNLDKDGVLHISANKRH